MSSQTNTETIQSTGETSSTTSTTTRTTDLQIQLFHDYHGDGQQQSDEPSISDLVLDIQGIGNDYRATLHSESNGEYWARNILVWKNYQILPKTDKFRYIALSNAQLSGISDYRHYVDTNEPSLHLGLMEGFLTLPFHSNTRYSVGRFYDWDPSELTYLWWNGKKGFTGGGIYGIDPNHIGIDYDIPEGEDVLACAPGFVSYFEKGPQGQLGLTIKHTAGDLAVYYSHLSRYVVKMNQQVARGEKVAESGKTGAAYPHLHINNYRIVGELQQLYDFYAPTFPLSGALSGYWERKLPDGSFYWKTVKEDEHPNREGFWTTHNDPKFFV